MGDGGDPGGAVFDFTVLACGGWHDQVNSADIQAVGSLDKD